MKKNLMRQCVLDYARSKAKLALLLVFFAVLTMVIFRLYHVRWDAAVYAAVLCGCIGLVAAAFDFVAFCKRHVMLHAMDGCVSYSIDELPVAATPVEADYQRLLRELFESRSRLLAETEEARRYMSDYYAMWVHQIKVPIAAMHLLMGDEKNSPLALELFKIEQYVEMALSYVRLNAGSTDYVIKEYELEPVVKQAVRKYAPLFIARKLSLNIGELGGTVITDEKWLQFVIEQILSNSLKYTKKGMISIYLEEPKTLVIEDTGIGIAPEDISRIGEKGFTGYNGRLDKKSTGLGLYLCREILGRLSHRLEISSQVGAGTKVKIHMKNRDMGPAE